MMDMNKREKRKYKIKKKRKRKGNIQKKNMKYLNK
jgi:hypothetical protein